MVACQNVATIVHMHGHTNNYVLATLQSHCIECNIPGLATIQFLAIQLLKVKEVNAIHFPYING